VWAKRLALVPQIVIACAVEAAERARQPMSEVSAVDDHGWPLVLPAALKGGHALDRQLPRTMGLDHATGEKE